jgi:hypothetical protein
MFALVLTDAHSCEETVHRFITAKTRGEAWNKLIKTDKSVPIFDQKLSYVLFETMSSYYDNLCVTAPDDEHIEFKFKIKPCDRIEKKIKDKGVLEVVYANASEDVSESDNEDAIQDFLLFFEFCEEKFDKMKFVWTNEEFAKQYDSLVELFIEDGTADDPFKCWSLSMTTYDHSIPSVSSNGMRCYDPDMDEDKITCIIPESYDLNAWNTLIKTEEGKTELTYRMFGTPSSRVGLFYLSAPDEDHIRVNFNTGVDDEEKAEQCKKEEAVYLSCYSKHEDPYLWETGVFIVDYPDLLVALSEAGHSDISPNRRWSMVSISSDVDTI